MARYKGKDGAVTVGASALGEIKSFDVTVTTQELDASVMGIDWTDVESGQHSASGSIVVLRDPSDPGQAALTIGSTPTLVLYTEGNTAGLTSISGDFLVTEVGISSASDNLVQTTYSIKNAGTITIGTVGA